MFRISEGANANIWKEYITFDSAKYTHIYRNMMHLECAQDQRPFSFAITLTAQMVSTKWANPIYDLYADRGCIDFAVDRLVCARCAYCYMHNQCCWCNGTIAQFEIWYLFHYLAPIERCLLIDIIVSNSITVVLQFNSIHL